jgi:hypothetical protein
MMSGAAFDWKARAQNASLWPGTVLAMAPSGPAKATSARSAFTDDATIALCTSEGPAHERGVRSCEAAAAHSARRATSAAMPEPARTVRKARDED